MSRLQRTPTPLAVLAGVLLAVGLVAFAVSGVGAGQGTVEIYRVASASFEGFPEGPVFVAIVGTDDRPGVAGARADAIHLVGVNPALHKGTLLDIPRDTLVSIPGRGRTKITNSHLGGHPEVVAAALRSLTGADVRYVVTTNFQGFTELVDEMGGVTVDIPRPIFDDASGANFSPGRRTLSGTQALAMARARKGVPNGDFTRTHHQGLLLLAALRQVRQMHPDPVATIKLVGTLVRHLKTSYGVGLSDLYRLGRLALSMRPADFVHVTLPGHPAMVNGASVVIPDPEATALLEDFADDGVVQNPPA